MGVIRILFSGNGYARMAVLSNNGEPRKKTDRNQRRSVRVAFRRWPWTYDCQYYYCQCRCNRRHESLLLRSNGGYSPAERSTFGSTWSCDCLATIVLAAETHATASRTTTVDFNKTILSDVWWRCDKYGGVVVSCADRHGHNNKNRQELVNADETEVWGVLDNSTQSDRLRSIATRNVTVHGAAVLLRLQQIKWAYIHRILLL